MPNTKAPISSDGPSGAMAPPKSGTSAATGTIASAAIAISSSPPSRPSASPARQKAPPRRGEAEFGFQEGDAERRSRPGSAPPTPAGRRAAPARPGSRSRPAPRPRNSRSMPTLARVSGALNAAVDMGTPRWLAFRSRGRASSSGRPIWCARTQPGGWHCWSIRPSSRHRACTSLAAEQFVQHEPVGRRPVAGVAIG